jgi:uncharacterized protein YabE (DUF348 family)
VLHIAARSAPRARAPRRLEPRAVLDPDPWFFAIPRHDRARRLGRVPHEGPPVRSGTHPAHHRRCRGPRPRGRTAAFAHAQKTVTLDVNGEVAQLSTFAGSVDGLLDDQGVVVGERDVVSQSGSLREGAEIVVRHAHQVSVSVDGEETSVWTTALTADEALDSLAARGQSVALVASRSAAGGRPELALDLTLHGPADVLVDGTTLEVTDADASVAQVLGELGVTLNALDRVSVVQGASGRVQVVVNRVVVQDVTSTQEVPFASTTQQDAARYTDQKRTLTAGVLGVRTLVERVTTVDGVESGRVTVSDAVTTAPVDEVLSVGTKDAPGRREDPLRSRDGKPRHGRRRRRLAQLGRAGQVRVGRQPDGRLLDGQVPRALPVLGGHLAGRRRSRAPLGRLGRGADGPREDALQPLRCGPVAALREEPLQLSNPPEPPPRSPGAGVLPCSP